MFRKMHVSGLVLAFAIANLATVATAGTVIKIMDEGDVTTMLTNGKLARLSMSAGEEEYVIVDLASQKVKIVNPHKKQVMVFDMDSTAHRQAGMAAKPSSAKLLLKKTGTTKNIAGYQSDKYEYGINGKRCGDVYLSKSAYRVKGVQQLAQAMQAMMEQQKSIMGGFTAMMDDCEQADNLLTEKMDKTGVPMQWEQHGRLVTQVTSIDVDVDLSADVFVVPASYKKVTMQEMMQQAYQGDSVDAANDYQSSMGDASPLQMPTQAQMQEIMQQMQQAGQFTPEMMEQMQQAQEMMMQQYQQPGY